MLRAYRNGLAESERVKFVDGFGRSLVVGLIRGKDDRFAAPVRHAADLGIG